jgi:hypothetical protein
LGGIPQPDLNNPGVFLGMTGFGTDPTNPFTNNQNNGNAAYGPNRTPPFYEFVASRLQVMTAYQLRSAGMTLAGPYYQAPHTVFPGYLDSLSSQTVLNNSNANPVKVPSSGQNNFYAYFSTNNGQGYDPNDVNFMNQNYDVDVNGGFPLVLTFNVPFAFPTLGPIYSPSPNPYTTGEPYTQPATTGQAPPNVTYQNPQSFQIISPGLDGAYGLGGLYNPNSPTSPLPQYPTSPVNLSNTSDTDVRNMERDNLTNFHNGKLD